MGDLEKQIEAAKRKPLNSDNLNYIGDLYLKSGDKRRAVAYFFESVEKLHYAQKEKKMATYKKILNISPDHEKAYIGIIEILSKMGLVMEEKKYLHMLAELYESRRESDKAEELINRIKELDPHVVIDGTFFHHDVRKKILTKQRNASETDIVSLENSDSSNTGLIKSESVDDVKLIEASLEEIKDESGMRWKDYVSMRYKMHYAAVALLLIAVSLIVYKLWGSDHPEKKPKLILPVTFHEGDFDISLSAPEDLSMLGAIATADLKDSDIYLLTLANQSGCIPRTFAEAPYEMISLVDKNGAVYKLSHAAELKKSAKAVAKMNVCGEETAIVFMRLPVIMDRQHRYTGIRMEGLNTDSPVVLKWDGK